MKMWIVCNTNRIHDVSILNSRLKTYEEYVKDNSQEDSVELFLLSLSVLQSDIKICYSARPKASYTFLKEFADFLRSDIQEMLETNEELNISSIVDSKFESRIVFDKKHSSQTNNQKNEGSLEEFDYQKLSKQFIPIVPKYSFDRVIIKDDLRETIIRALNKIKYEQKLFSEWGLSVVQPNPSCALNFYGPSGTGKSMAAEAIASYLGKKILKASYSDIESKYVGEGPKMAKAIFLAAQNNDAILFIDEADSLLSKRLTNISHGSDQSINSMRSQLLICLEEFKGIVIFATNLNQNYDNAFLTRLINIKFCLPDGDTRKKIWDVHISGDGIKIPLDPDVNTVELATKYDFSGREIRNATVSACVNCVTDNRDIVNQRDFIKACDMIVAEKKAIEEDRIKNEKVNTELKEVAKTLIKKNSKKKKSKRK